jgi:hypothetical protein
LLGEIGHVGPCTSNQRRAALSLAGIVRFFSRSTATACSRLARGVLRIRSPVIRLGCSIT